MELNTLKKAVSEIHPGSFFRMSYVTDVPVKKEFKNEGYSIKKEVQLTTRTGVRYVKINGVQLSDNPKKATNNYVWEMKNFISYNTNTEKYYFNIYPIGSNANIRTHYFLYKDGELVTADDSYRGNGLMENKILSSYMNKGGSGSKICKIKVENINSIERVKGGKKKQKKGGD